MNEWVVEMLDAFKIGGSFRRRFIGILLAHLAISECLSQDFVQLNSVPAVTIQQPTLGVSINTAGILSAKIFTDPTGQLSQKRIEFAQQNIPQELHATNSYRKISLRRLEKELSRRLDAGEAISDSMKHLAGLTSIEFAFLFPESNDIVVAGPAEPWIRNLAGRSIGANTGQPIVLLEDWLVAMRAFAPDTRKGSWIACSIDPTANGLERLREFRARLPRNIASNMQAVAARQLTQQLGKSLGQSDVNVYGIDPRTHAARVMVEADYRMKAIAIGLEIPPAPIKTFIQVLKGAPTDFQRWWLTPDYKCLMQSKDGYSVQMIGQGVSLQTETIKFDANANIQKTNIKPTRAARTYASSFTKNYSLLARNRPVFAQLRNVIDCFVMAAWLKKQDAFNKCRWRPSVMLNESKLPVNNHQQIKKAESLANGLWKKGVLLLPSGGVAIDPRIALGSNSLRIEDQSQLKDKSSKIVIPVDQNVWWWD